MARIIKCAGLVVCVCVCLFDLLSAFSTTLDAIADTDNSAG